MRSRRSVWLWVSVALAVIAAAWFGFGRRREAARSIDNIEWVAVRRDDLDTTLLAGGDLEPVRFTTVACQVEDITDSDGTTILSLVSNGALVKKGDELCRLDSSQFEELARQQEIIVNQVRAICLQAQLVFETARIGLREYQEGLVTQFTKEFEGRIALRKQIENCTIRAPQAGVVLHTNEGSPWAPPLQPGDRVYQDQGMFRLSDLTQAEVMVSVAESMGSRVRVGMTAGISVPSLAGRVFPGQVTAINQLPSVNWKMDDEKVKRFVVWVRLDETPPGVRMFMSAAVLFDTGRVPDALVIPVEAVSVVQGRQSCYVVGSNRLERRAITTRRATTDLLEVTGGLSEGEHVVLRSLDVRGIPAEDTTRDRASDSARERTASPSRSESPAQMNAQAS
ncbi:MAG: efflux RND transporter periplasmic adaptor subunit [Isosphaerales bacterium]